MDELSIEGIPGTGIYHVFVPGVYLGSIERTLTTAGDTVYAVTDTGAAYRTRHAAAVALVQWRTPPADDADRPIALGIVATRRRM